MSLAESTINTFQSLPLPQILTDKPDWVLDLYHNSPKLWGYDDFANAMKWNRGTIANAVSEGNAPNNGFILGKKRVFPRLDAVLWIFKMSQQSTNKGA